MCGVTRQKWSIILFAFGKVRRPCRMLVALISLRASCHDGFGHGRSGSSVTGSTWRWNSSRTQSMMRMMRCGGFASLRTTPCIRTYIHITYVRYTNIQPTSHAFFNVRFVALGYFFTQQILFRSIHLTCSAAIAMQHSGNRLRPSVNIIYQWAQPVTAVLHGDSSRTCQVDAAE